MFLGLRTVIYPAPDLDAAKAWWTSLLGVDPYFDEPFYVGYTVAGYELALLPDLDSAVGAITYWGVRDCDEAMAWLLNSGAREREPVTDVGNDIRTATVLDPAGNVVGIIENPHFHLPETPATSPGK